MQLSVVTFLGAAGDVDKEIETHCKGYFRQLSAVQRVGCATVGCKFARPSHAATPHAACRSEALNHVSQPCCLRRLASWWWTQAFPTCLESWALMWMSVAR